MSSFGGGGGGRTRMGVKVYLNVYDLSPANDYLYPVGLGLHHSGLEILGSEYSFASGAGVFEGTPEQVPNARFREKITMGAFEGGMQELNRCLDELRHGDFGPDDYNLVQRNCNHFADALCWMLLRRRLPGHVNRLADIGVCCKCLLPRSLLETAPVGDPNSNKGGGGGGASSGGFSVTRPAGRAQQNNNPNNNERPTAFSGTGNRLDGGTTTDSTKKNGGKSLWGSWGTSSESKSLVSSPQGRLSPDDLTDRREKARKAALARLEQQNKQQQ